MVIKLATSAAVPNLVHTRLRRLLGKWAKYNHNYYLLIYIYLLVDTSRGQPPRLILMADGSDDANLRKGLTFQGFFDAASHFRGSNPPNPNFGGE